MPIPSRIFPLALCAIFLAALIPTAPAQQEQQAQGNNKEANKPRVRLICVATHSENQKVVLATKSEEGEWRELAETELKSPHISGWIPARPGRLLLAVREAEGLVEIGSFNYPAASKRAVVVVFPHTDKGKYRTEVFDPAKLGFVKGTTLAINYSGLQGAIVLGSQKATVKPGDSKVVKARPDANGMFRMLVAYANEKKETVVCYDRYIPVNEDSRYILFLLPDPTLGLRVFSLSEFGPFE